MKHVLSNLNDQGPYNELCESESAESAETTSTFHVKDYDLSDLVCKGELKGFNINPVNDMRFHNKDNELVGKLVFDKQLIFEGDVDQTTSIFMEFLTNSFNQRLEQIIQEQVELRVNESIESNESIKDK